MNDRFRFDQLSAQGRSATFGTPSKNPFIEGIPC